MQQLSRNVFKRIKKMILRKCCKRKRNVLNKLLINKVVNKVEYSRVNIFYKEKHFFCKFTWEYKVTSFSKVKVACRESKDYG